MKGAFWVWRKLFHREDWLAPDRRKPACNGYAWLYLCSLAQHKDYTHGGIVLGRGELVVSIRSFAQRMGWTVPRASRFVIKLKSERMIETVSETPTGTVYRVVTYEPHQNPTTASETPSETPSETRARRERYKNKNEEGRSTLRSTSLPDSWQPTDSHRARCLRDKLSLEREVEGFRSHHLSRGNKMLNWDQAFFTWLTNAVKFSSGKNGSGAHSTSGALARPRL